MTFFIIFLGNESPGIQEVANIFPNNSTHFTHDADTDISPNIQIFETPIKTNNVANLQETVSAGTNIKKIMLNSWFSYHLFLIFLGKDSYTFQEGSNGFPHNITNVVHELNTDIQLNSLIVKPPIKTSIVADFQETVVTGNNRSLLFSQYLGQLTTKET